MDRVDKINSLNKFLTSIDLGNKKVSIKLVKFREDISPVVMAYKERRKIYIDERLIDELSLGELKSLIAHEYAHFRYQGTGNPFWYYFFFKYLWLVFLCSFSFNFNFITYFLFAIVLSSISVIFIMKSQKQAEIAREIEYKCDRFAIKNTSKESFVNLLNKFEDIEKNYFNLDKIICSMIFGRYHPKYSDRIKVSIY